MALRRINAPQRLAPTPPAPSADTMRIAKGQDIVSLRPEPRRDPGQLYQPRVSAELAAILMQIRKVR